MKQAWRRLRRQPGFTLVAVATLALGLHGMLAFSVARRAREIGLRVALGARRSQVSMLVLREGLGLAAAGILLGWLGALATAGLLAGLLFGIRPIDPATFAAVTALLGVTAVAACLLPAARAVRVDPAVALRSE